MTTRAQTRASEVIFEAEAIPRADARRTKRGSPPPPGGGFEAPPPPRPSSPRSPLVGTPSLAAPSKSPPSRAPNVTCPVMFVVQWDDELFGRNGAFELFDLIGTSDKRLVAKPGKHAALPAETVEATREFLGGRLEG